MRADAPDALRDVLATLRHGVRLSKPPSAPPASRSLRRPPSGASRASAPSRFVGDGRFVVDAHARTVSSRRGSADGHGHGHGHGHVAARCSRARRRAILDPRVVAWLGEDDFDFEDENVGDENDDGDAHDDRYLLYHRRGIGRAIVVARGDGDGFRDATVGDVEDLLDGDGAALTIETRMGSSARRRPATSAETAELAAAYLSVGARGRGESESNDEALADARDAWPGGERDSDADPDRPRDGEADARRRDADAETETRRAVAFVYDESRATAWGRDDAAGEKDEGGERCRRARPAFVAVCRPRRAIDEDEDEDEDDADSPGRGRRSGSGNTHTARSRGDDALDALVHAGAAVAAISRDAARTAAGSASATAAFASRGRGRRRGETNRLGGIPAPIDWSARDDRLTRAAEAVDEAEEALRRARRETASLESVPRAESRRRDARVGEKSVTFASEDSRAPPGDAFAPSTYS